MTANEILKNYSEALQMSDSSPIKLENVILDILKYLDYKESGKDRGDEGYEKYRSDKLWGEITEKSLPSPHDSNTISLVQLRIILEKFKILEEEKDGM